MFFAILGKNKQISLKELEYIQPIDLKQVNDFIITFETNYPERLSKLGGIIKWGHVVDENDLAQELQDIKIIGINNEELGKKFKKDGIVRRFKLVKLGHTDLEIKKKGKELVKIDATHYGIVDGFQNIELYEVIDFGKPARSMQMGMMPAKLAHIMINIGISNASLLEKGGVGEDLVIYDPFVGSGTIGFLANYLGSDFLASDIKTTSVTTNLARRKTNKFYNPNKQFEIFQQDITQPITRKSENNLLIITEGRLGPIIRETATSEEIKKAQSEVQNLYTSFIERIHECKCTAVFTIPWYTGTINTIEEKIQELCTKFGLNCSSISELYKREDQHIGRKIIIIQ